MKDRGIFGNEEGNEIFDIFPIVGIFLFPEISFWSNVVKKMKCLFFYHKRRESIKKVKKVIIYTNRGDVLFTIPYK